MAKKTMSFEDYKKACKGGEMTYKGYVAMAKGGGKAYMSPEEYQKAENGGDDDEMEDGGGGEGGDEEEDTEKALIDASDLMKAIGDYEIVEAALNAGPLTREAVLTTKMREGTISKSEQAELGAIWANGGGDDAGDTLSKSLMDAIEDDDPDAAAMVDASDFLKSLVNGVNETLTDVRDSVLRDSETTRQLLRGQGTLIKSLAGVVASQDEIIKSQNKVMREMGRRLGVLESQPVVRKSQGADPRDVQARNPGGDLGRGDGDPAQLTKSMVFQGINSLLAKAEQAGDDVAIDRLAHASSLLETSGQVAPNILAAVKRELGVG